MGPVEVLWDGDGVPPRKDMGPVQVLWDGDGVPPPPPGWTNKLKLLPSLNPSDASGNKTSFEHISVRKMNIRKLQQYC